MVNPAPIYALPQRTRPTSSSARAKKRKREATEDQDAADADTDLELSRSPEPPTGDVAIEYAAVLTPAERAQHRLAGLAFNESSPSYPFPHRDPSRPARDDTNSVAFASDDFKPLQVRGSDRNNLRTQHLATMMAVLHKSMAAKDFKRASRALSLILRHDAHGEAVDIRHASLWGIGAELLLHDRGMQDSITEIGFQLAKRYYDMLANSFPPSKTWEEAVNAHDFYSAMFGLWVYATCQESYKLQSEHIPFDIEDDPETTAMSVANAWTLEQAQAIGKEMDNIMSRVPYMDNIELIRLRAMVKAWIADLDHDPRDEQSRATEANGAENTTIPT